MIQISRVPSTAVSGRWILTAGSKKAFAINLYFQIKEMEINAKQL